MSRPFPDPSILLHPQIPKPLHLLNPRSIFGGEWWNKQRKLAYEKNHYQCHACGVHKILAAYHQWLEAHEFYEINYKTGEVTFVEVVALCHACHNYIHQGRMLMILGTDEMPESKYNAIVSRGNKVLREAHLKKKTLKSKCSWEDWHLVIEGINYGQRFHSFKEWAKYWKVQVGTPEIYGDMYGDRQ